MRIYIAGKKYYWYHEKPFPIDDFHADMFHGFDLRERIIDLGQEINGPMQLVKNVYHIGDIICPDRRWVVSEQVKKDLESLPNVSFLEVSFVRVFNYPYEENDFNFRGVRGTDDSEKFIMRLRSDNALAKNLPSYYEMVLTRYIDIPSKERPAYTVSTDFEEKCGIVRIGLDADFLAEYPVFTHGKVFMSDAAFAILKKYINPLYFYVKEYELTDDPYPVSRRIM